MPFMPVTRRGRILSATLAAAAGAAIAVPAAQAVPRAPGTRPSFCGHDNRHTPFAGYLCGQAGYLLDVRIGDVHPTRSIVDTRTGTLVPTLEDFAIALDGHPYHAADVNFWGVTFAAGDDAFYAALATAGHTYLVKGSLSRRTVTTLLTNVECRSLSPDGTRIAFKRYGWRSSCSNTSRPRRTRSTRPGARTGRPAPGWGCRPAGSSRGCRGSRPAPGHGRCRRACRVRPGAVGME